MIDPDEPTPGDQLVGGIVAELDDPDPPVEGDDLIEALEILLVEVRERLGRARDEKRRKARGW